MITTEEKKTRSFTPEEKWNYCSISIFIIICLKVFLNIYIKKFFLQYFINIKNQIKLLGFKFIIYELLREKHFWILLTMFFFFKYYAWGLLYFCIFIYISAWFVDLSQSNNTIVLKLVKMILFFIIIYKNFKKFVIYNSIFAMNLIKIIKIKNKYIVAFQVSLIHFMFFWFLLFYFYLKIYKNKFEFIAIFFKFPIDNMFLHFFHNLLLFIIKYYYYLNFINSIKIDNKFNSNIINSIGPNKLLVLVKSHNWLVL